MVWFVISRLTVVWAVLATGRACILLLNGWTPMTIAKRTQQADIVVTARVLKAYKKVEEPAKTYTAQVRIEKIYKGHAAITSIKNGVNKRLNKVRKFIKKDVKSHNLESQLNGEMTDSDDGLGDKSTGTSMTFNVSNFGSRTQCYADVTEGKDYIMFLTVYDGRLSAKYDDIFGAVVLETEESRDEVLRAVGWGDWSAWQGCSASCGGGVQIRGRKCRRKKTSESCPGSGQETRKCNAFSCTGVVDMMRAFGLPAEPNGVRSSNTQNAYVIKASAALSAESKKYFRRGFPLNFVLVMAFRLPSRWQGALFLVRNSKNKLLFSVSYCNRNIFARFYQNGTSNDDSEVFFPIDMSDQKRHHIVLKIETSSVTLIHDCAESDVRGVRRPNMEALSLMTTVLSMGMRGDKELRRFKGELHEFLLLEDTRATAAVCSGLSPLAPAIEDKQQKDSSSVLDRAWKTPLTAWSTWSAWSACSASCGQGIQTRERRCTDSRSGRHAQNCEGATDARFQAKLCAEKSCKGACAPSCQNGGTCTTFGACVCPRGFYGNICQNVSCYPGCYNGGVCKRPSVCECPSGFTGDLCQNAVCENGCQNGGRCIHPGVCSCPYGYLPPDCSVPFCLSPCLNGGSCVAPNKCVCDRGYTGYSCESGQCSMPCRNGGTCVGRDLCVCVKGYEGILCEKGICRRPCLNGGRCVGPNRCKCGSRFKGRRCGKRRCRHRRRRMRVVTLISRKPVVYKSSVPCGPWLSRLCVQTKVEYVTVTRRAYRRVRKRCRRRKKQQK